MSGLRTGCVVSSYNYARYLGEAVESALKQAHPLDEIVIVDDGSSDGSAEMVKRRWSGVRQIQLIEKPNEGQLSCFNAGFEATTADIVFFMDADDLWEGSYTESVLRVYRANPGVDFVCTGVRHFGAADEIDFCEKRDRDMGYSLLETFHYRHWWGSPTSALSMRRSLLGRILPIPYLDDWRLRADDCLVFGASLAGGHKFHLASPLVRYRVHGENRHYGRKGGRDPAEAYRWRLAVARMSQHVLERAGNDPVRLARLANREFATIERPSRRQYRRYLSMLWRSDASLARRWRGSLAIRRHYRAQPPAEAAPARAALSDLGSARVRPDSSRRSS